MNGKLIVFLSSILSIGLLAASITNKSCHFNKNNVVITNNNPGNLYGIHGNYVIRCSENKIYLTNSVWVALHNAIDGDTIIFNGHFTEKQINITYGSSPMTKARNNLSIIGLGNSLIDVVITNISYANECAMDLSAITNLYISGLNLRVKHNEYNNKNTYGLWLNSCQNVLVENSTIQSEVYGSNNIEKTFVATINASNVVIYNSTIISVDLTGSNKIFHTATHNAQPTTFQNCKFIATNNKVRYTVGKAIFSDCTGNIANKSILPLTALETKSELLGDSKEVNKVYEKMIYILQNKNEK